MAKILSLVSISVPGGTTAEGVGIEDNPHIKRLVQSLDRAGIEYKEVDSFPGWGNLNQDWIEFSCEITTAWSWCKPTFLWESEWKALFAALATGQLIMMVQYKIHKEDGTYQYVPHG